MPDSKDRPGAAAAPVVGVTDSPEWLDRDWLLSQFDDQRSKAVAAYKQFVAEESAVSSPLDQTRHQLLLGDDSFVERYRLDHESENLREVSKTHKRSLALSLKEYQGRAQNRDEAMAKAYLSGAYTMAEIGQYFGVHYMTVSRAVRKFERKAMA